MVLDFCNGGDIRSLIDTYKTMKINISTNHVRNIYRQIILGFLDLANNGLVHRNLTPENFMLDFRRAGPTIDKKDYYLNQLKTVDVYIKDFSRVV